LRKGPVCQKGRLLPRRYPRSPSQGFAAG
jgi:hypothetical protein